MDTMMQLGTFDLMSEDELMYTDGGFVITAGVAFAFGCGLGLGFGVGGVGTYMVCKKLGL